MIYSMVTMQCICKRLRKEWILKVLITRRNKWWLKQTWCRGPFQRALASSRYVVHLECMFGDRCISAETCFGVRRAAERPCTFFGLFTASLCLGSLWRKSEDPRAVTLFDLTVTQAPAASPLSCGARGPYAVCCVCVLLWTCLAVPLLHFPAASKCRHFMDLPPCNQEELPGKPRASLSSESDLGLWSLRVASLA